jgi:hypothetical protein
MGRQTSRSDSLARNDDALASKSLKLLFGVVGGVVLMFDQKANPGKTCSLSRAKPLGTRKAAAKPKGNAPPQQGPGVPRLEDAG